MSKIKNFNDYIILIEEGLIKTYDIDFVVLKSLERLLDLLVVLDQPF
jgi:hypothetical protein